MRDHLDRRAYREAKKSLLAYNYVRFIVKTAAQDRTGRLIDSPQSFIIAGPRHGVGSIWVRYHGPPLPDKERKRLMVLNRHRLGSRDIEDVVCRSLGREEQNLDGLQVAKKPSSQWAGLISALTEADIHITEEELIALPLTFMFDDDTQKELSVRPNLRDYWGRYVRAFKLLMRI